MSLTIRKLYFILIFISALVSCRKDRCLKGTGDIIKEERDAGTFEVLEIGDNINLVLTQSDSSESSELTIEGGSNLVPFIETIYRGDTLFLSNNNTCDWLRSYKHTVTVYLKADKIEHIIYKGSGDVKTTSSFIQKQLVINQWAGSGNVSLDMQTDLVKIILHTGSASYKLGGATQFLSLYSTSTGPIDARKLAAEKVSATNNSTNNFKVQVTNRLIARINQSGSIYYSGNPTEIDSMLTSSGELKKLKE